MMRFKTEEQMSNPLFPWKFFAMIKIHVISKIRNDIHTYCTMVFVQLLTDRQNTLVNTHQKVKHMEKEGEGEFVLN